MAALRDPACFDRAYRDLLPAAIGAATRVLRDPAAAEDVAQEVFLRLWLDPEAYDSRRGSLSRYVTMMAHSRALDRWRSRAVREAAVERSARELPPEPASEESAADPVIRRERSLRLLGALDELPADQRQAVLLAYGRGLTAGEIARAADVPLGTAKSRVRLGLERARAHLRAAA